MPGQQVGAAEEAEEERHDGVRDLLGAVGVDVDETEAELRGRCGVRGAVGGSQAEQQLPRPEPALRGAREEGQRGEEHGRGGLDVARGECGAAPASASRSTEGVLEVVERHHRLRT